jgi:hypothetical protein
METGLFEIQAEHLRQYRQNRQLLSDSRDVIQELFRQSDSVSAHMASLNRVNKLEAAPDFAMKSEFAQCFLRLSNLPNFALDRLSRYEATLWRQATQILYALEKLKRHKPQERNRRLWLESF